MADQKTKEPEVDSPSRLEQALRLAKLGLGIFPLAANSKVPPEGSNGFYDATMEADAIRAMFADNPNANYGVYPGSRFVIVDLDTKKGQNGLETLALCTGLDETDLLKSTLVVKTPSGGRHLYFKTDKAYGSRVEVLPGVDIRAVGGYVVGPSSYVNDGKVEGSYEIKCDVEIADLRPEIAKLLTKSIERDAKADDPLFQLDLPGSIQRAYDFLENRASAIEGRGGDEHTYVTACELKDLGVSEDMCLALMMEPDGWNSRCVPPWDAGELSAKVRNAFEYGKQRPGAKGGGFMEMYERMFGIECVDVTDLSLDPVNDNSEPDLPVEGDPKAKLKNSVKAMMLDGDQIARWKVQREMIIPGWLPAHGFTALLAKRGVGKTVTMLDLGLRLACDMDWHDIKCESDLAVVYLCGEDAEGLKDQYRAWSKHHGRTPDECRFIMIPAAPDLLKPAIVEAWTEAIKETVGDKRCVVMLDTWQRATSKASQSDEEQMQTAVHHVEAMARSLGGPAITAAHPPKHSTESIMGSSVIENATTTIWTLEDGPTGKKLEVTRIKGAAAGQTLITDFEIVRLGEFDQFEKERTGVVPRKFGGSEQSIKESDDMRRLGLEAASVVRKEQYSPAGEVPDIPMSTRKLAKELGPLLKRAESTIRPQLTKLTMSHPHGFDLGDMTVLIRVGNEKAGGWRIDPITDKHPAHPDYKP